MLSSGMCSTLHTALRSARQKKTKDWQQTTPLNTTLGGADKPRLLGMEVQH